MVQQETCLECRGRGDVFTASGASIDCVDCDGLGVIDVERYTVDIERLPQCAHVDRIAQYEAMVEQTAIHPDETMMDGLTYCVPALAAEAGEVAGKFAKLVRDNHGAVDSVFVQAMLQELGDVLWTTVRTTQVLGYTLTDIMDMNETKLRSRKARGKLSGSGDER